MPMPCTLEMEREGVKLHWDLDQDQALLFGIDKETGASRQIWSGGLLPAYELAAENGSFLYVKGTAQGMASLANNRYRIQLGFDRMGSGVMECEIASWGLRIVQLETFWTADTRVIALYFGTRLLNDLERTRTPRLDRTFWPDWSSEGYCVPVAGSSPTSSFWRSWDMGDARLPLGSFGDAMGTPYAAAYPRPIYGAVMGGRSGWMAFGPGEVPDAPVTLKLQSATACLQYLYREDLWIPSDSKYRVMKEPLRLCWGPSGYDALHTLYGTFGKLKAKSPEHQRSFLCTWGDFKEGRFNLKQFTARVEKQSPADMIVLDDSWETFNGSGVPNLELFPHFEDDLENMREHGYELAFWQSIGWIDDPDKAGLTAGDLLCGPDGVPRQWTWSGNPLRGSRYHYCLDPSSERTRRYIRERTEHIVRKWNPVALKLDFGYGFPSPDVCAPRNPAYRGERLCVELLRLIGEAAKGVNPDITIIYYGIHPLLHDVIDLINLDDLGDAGDSAKYERIGHNQRCLWASLAAAHGMAINTSTGYYWGALDSILLDTAVVGANGLTLGEFDAEGKLMSPFLMNRWHALQAWRRRTCGWKALWLEADKGGLGSEPSITSWGRLEQDEEDEFLASLVLRNDGTDLKQYHAASFIQFTGNWAVISQDNSDMKKSRKLACIPFEAGTLVLDREFSSITAYGVVNGVLTKTASYTKMEVPELILTVHKEQLNEIAGFIIE